MRGAQRRNPPLSVSWPITKNPTFASWQPARPCVSVQCSKKFSSIVGTPFKKMTQKCSSSPGKTQLAENLNHSDGRHAKHRWHRHEENWPLTKTEEGTLWPLGPWWEMPCDLTIKFEFFEPPSAQTSGSEEIPRLSAL